MEPRFRGVAERKTNKRNSNLGGHNDAAGRML